MLSTILPRLCGSPPQVMVHFALHSSLISLLLERFQCLINSLAFR